MEREISAVKKFICDLFPAEQFYFDAVPVEIKIPSIYFPLPSVENTLISKTGDTRLDITQEVTVYSNSQIEGLKKVTEIRLALATNKFLISLYNKGGSLSTDKLLITSLDIRSVQDIEITAEFRFFII